MYRWYKNFKGERAARWALNDVYGKNICWETANLVSAMPEGDHMVLTFDNDVMPENMGHIPEGFSIADKSGKFYMAEAAYPLVDGSCETTKILVWSQLVKEPVAVRYAWARDPIGNLKVDGKPWQALQSFRTDSWDWPESENPMKGLDKPKTEAISCRCSQASGVPESGGSQAGW